MPSGKGVYGDAMCVLLIDLRPDMGPLPGETLSALSPAQERTLLLAKQLGRAGISAATVCFAGSALAGECEAHGLEFHALKAGISGFSLYLALRRILSRRTVRVVHLFGFEALSQVAWLRRSGLFRFVQTIDENPSALARSQTKALRRVDAFLTTSGQLADELMSRAASGAVWLAPRGKGKGPGVPPLIRSILPCTLPVWKKSVSSAFSPIDIPPGHPARQGAKDGNTGRFLFFASCSSASGAGLSTLFSAMARLRVLEEPSPWEVRVTGELADFASILAEAEDLRTEERLALLGAQDNDALMPLCDAVISSVDEGGQPDLILSAWTHSLPVIAPFLPDHEELDPSGKAFLRFFPATPVELAEAMQELMRNREKREKLVAAGKAAAERLSPESFCAAHLEVYEDLGAALPSVKRG